MLLDANLLVYAVDERSRQHAAAAAWLEETLNGTRRVGIPWLSLDAFLRLATNPRVMPESIDAATAWAHVEEWLEAPTVWTPQPGPNHRVILGGLITDLDLRADLIPDAVLAALCIEHGLEMLSADTDFARFTDITWRNPLSP